MFIVTAKEMYDIDHYTMQTIGYGNLLMENAGRAVAEKITKIISKEEPISVFVGTGHNGGDGYVVARTLWNIGYDIEVIQVGENEKLKPEVRFHKQLFINCRGTVHVAVDDETLQHVFTNKKVVIDALIGIGLTENIREPIATAISLINKEAEMIVSVDIPSGLPSDEGNLSSIAIQAHHTITIGAPKMSMFIPSTEDFYGNWDVVSIGHSPFVFEKYTNRIMITKELFQQTMPRRKKSAHKGDHGRGLIIGGCDNMPGALAMAVKAALKTGAGLMTARSTKQVINRISSQCLEAMYEEYPDQDGYLVVQNKPAFSDKLQAVAIGVGIGRNPNTAKVIKEAIEHVSCPLIVDADGLYHLSQMQHVLKQRSSPTIITPHTGEMARLLGVSIEKLMQRPFHYAREYATTYQTYVILKGRHTIITSPTGEQAVNMTGNPGLAKGGSGDVLTGIITAMVMQKMSIFQALCNACFVHGMSADILVADNHTYYDLLATDVIEGIANVYRTFL
ncbi:NAD(P)H-hydrate dehydratase [Virgibacillus soli]